MKIQNEYVMCSCGSWARIERAEDKSHRDRIVCSKCGSIVVMDNIPPGVQIRIREAGDDGKA